MKPIRAGMTIGALAKAGGVHVETIRYYERRGLLDQPAKPAGGQRRYADAVVGRLGFIRRAQQLGFSLDEVKGLLRLSHGRRPADTREMCERKYAELRRRSGQLAKMRRQLRLLIDRSRKAAAGGSCPIIGALWES